MPERVAIVGSREGVNQFFVHVFLEDLWRKYPDTILVSGGAKGVDTDAESFWLAKGGRVESLRPVQIRDGVYGVEKWELGGDNPRTYLLVNELTFENYKSAAIYRDIMIAEIADRCVSMQRAGGSRGASFTAEMSEFCYEKPTYRYYDEAKA